MGRQGHGAHISSQADYQRLYDQSIEDPVRFWDQRASLLTFFQPYDKVLEEDFAEQNFGEGQGRKREDVYAELRQVFDPEIPVNIVDLGLIYEVGIEESTVNITMTLTSQSCPSAQEIPDMMRRRVDKLDGVNETKIEVVYQPPWGPQLISEEGRKLLGMEDPE